MSRRFVKHYALGSALGLACLLGLFEISLDPQFALPRTTTVADPAQERRFAECFAERDAELHQRAFTQIDNPDVQREFIAAERSAVRMACRERYPQRQVTVRTPLRLKLLNFRFRYAD